MNLTSQKRIAAELMRCGVTRVRVKETKEAEEALTREDVRQLIQQGVIWKIQKKGTSRAKARHILKQKKRGRRRGSGSKKGRLTKSKPAWMSVIRAQRKLLADYRDAGQLSTANYRVLYGRTKGGMFRSKKHLLTYMREHDMLTIKAKGRKK